MTPKDLSYISDALSWELLAMKKTHHFAKECQDSQAKELLDKTSKMHQKHYETLLSYLESKT